MAFFVTGFTGCLSSLLSLPRTPLTDNCNHLLNLSPSLLPHPHHCAFLPSFHTLSARLFRTRERERDAAEGNTTYQTFLRSNIMAGIKHSFGIGVVAVLAALIFALSMPAAVHAQSPSPAPAPTSDGNNY